MVNVNLQAIEVGSLSNNVGVFSGQNIQNSWDSHTPNMVSFGVVMGDYCSANCKFAGLWSRSYSGQAMYDSDVKGNSSQYTIR
jgi:hypothetical protein